MARVAATKEFQEKIILSFVFLRKGEWLFSGIYTSDSVEKFEDHYQYKTTLTEHLIPLVGRLVVFFDKEFRQTYLKAEMHAANMEIGEIHRNRFVCDPFPGYENVHISHETLRQISLSEESSWKTALSIVKGVYLISDAHNGKLYIGKADGEEAIWQRWCNYASNGHGGNVDLVNLLNEKGQIYCANFRYSIIETLPRTIDDSVVQRRENYWKEVLKSRAHGYNRN